MKLWNPECTLRECFPSQLRNQKGAWDYMQNFLAAFNQANLNQGEQHVLRTCCLLAIPPPSPGVGGIIIMPPVDLSMIGVDVVGVIHGGPCLRHGNSFSSHCGEY